MTGGVEHVHAHEHASERHCPYCHDLLAEGAERWRCAKCASELHAGCAKELAKCPTLGCGERIHGLAAPLEHGEHERPPEPVTRPVLVQGPQFDPLEDGARRRAHQAIVAGLIVSALGAICALATIVPGWPFLRQRGEEMAGYALIAIGGAAALLALWGFALVVLGARVIHTSRESRLLSWLFRL